jgi:hypothetical protein
MDALAMAEDEDDLEIERRTGCPKFWKVQSSHPQSCTCTSFMNAGFHRVQVLANKVCKALRPATTVLQFQDFRVLGFSPKILIP